MCRKKRAIRLYRQNRMLFCSTTLPLIWLQRLKKSMSIRNLSKLYYHPQPTRSQALLGDQRLEVHARGHVNQADYHSKSGSTMLVAQIGLRDATLCRGVLFLFQKLGIFLQWMAQLRHASLLCPTCSRYIY
ncbi:uncharacterized protein LOC119288414 isoform X2 [Triticum dicoccoides]|uniref:uncharacterized protein LOC119288414 isoform X2 n=1 Tax=Triticum dicoccoides TaxID=85692 RepID=UPI00188F7345|nr:uncharacterized protein LOC119288414 isoform X2 [Triticum dicoccoides]